MSLTGCSTHHRSFDEQEDIVTSVSDQLREAGLTAFGGFDFDSSCEVLQLPSGKDSCSLILVGNAGEALWPQFQAWRRINPEVTNPLDIWSRQVIGSVAAQVGAHAVFPSDRPYLPFQQWATRAEGLRPSPLGILMHPEFGLWHAYRGALLFDRPLGLGPERPRIHLCDACETRPCLTVCPVGAHCDSGFDYFGCLAEVTTADRASCMSLGCGNRNACPQATQYRYGREFQAFLMAAFARRTS